MGPGGAATGISDGTLRAVLEELPVAVVVVDDSVRVVYGNALARALLGDELEAGQTVPWSEGESDAVIAPRATGAAFRATTVPLAQSEGLSLVVLTAVSLAGEGEPARDPHRHLAEVEATARVGSWAWDVGSDVVTWSDELYRLYGLVPQSIPITYETFLQRLPAEDRARVAEIIARCAETGQAAAFSHAVLLPDGEVRWHHCGAQPVMVDGRVVRMFGTAQDVTERRRAEHALRDSLAQARRLAEENEALRAEVEAQLVEVRASRSRIVQAADDARQRLERDLHDGAQQRLTTLGLILRSAQSRCGPDADPELASELRQAVEELQAGLGELRALAHGLHPAILTDEGLIPAVRALVARSPLPVKLAAGPVGRLPGPVEAAAYFVVSEALTNVVKHAAASSAHVRVDRNARSLVVEVNDDGRGGATIAAGSGLRGLSDRVAALDGLLDLQSPATGGTRLRVELPCA